MDDIDNKVRRFLLRPLVKKRKNLTDDKKIINSLKRIDQRTLGEIHLRQLRRVLSTARRNRSHKSLIDPKYARSLISLAKALYEARRISSQEYLFYASWPVIRIHEDRLIDGKYDEELQPISQAIDEIRERHNLSADEYWPVGQGPKAYTELNEKYDAVLEKKLIETLREFGCNDLANLKENQPDEFYRLGERGRRSLFHRGEYVAALKDLVNRYEEDAYKAASTNAYSSAVVSIAAALEGLLLLRCLRSKNKACSIARDLGNRSRPRNINDPTSWTFENLIDICFQAGWLHPVKTSVAIYNTADLAHVLRVIRNYVHPGKCARERPWIEIDEREYMDAEAIYTIVSAHLMPVRKKSRKPD